MELRRSKTLTIFIIFLLSQLRLIFAQTIMMSHSIHQISYRTPRTGKNDAAQPATPVQSPPPILPNPFVGRFRNPLLNRTRKRRNRSRARGRHSLNQEFLRAHNRVRELVGEPSFNWDTTLARYARAWAEKRVDDCQLVHSNGPYGENIFWGGRNYWKPGDVVKEWADEQKYYDMKANTCQTGQMCGHYTQIVWRDSTKIGCARAECRNGGVYVICVYDPPGNFEGENPFVPYKGRMGL